MPIILRNLLNGCTTFTAIADGAPGIPRSLLTDRLRELERVGVVWSEADPVRGRGRSDHLTEAGRDVKDFLYALGICGERWLWVAQDRLDPTPPSTAGREWYLVRDRLPDRRVVVRFEVPRSAREQAGGFWFVFARRAFGGLPQGPRIRGRPGRRGGVAARPRRMAPWPGGRGTTHFAPGAHPGPGTGHPGPGAADLEPPQPRRLGTSRRKAGGVQGQELCGGGPSRYSR